MGTPGTNVIVSFMEAIMIKGWEEALKRVKYAIEYGIHCNDLSHHEIEEEICFAFDQLAKENGMPEIAWEAEDDAEA